MPRALSPRRYAQAVFQIAVEADELDQWQRDLETLSTALQDPDMSRFLDAPQVPATAKTDAVNQTFGGSVGPLALNLVLLLGSRGAASLVPAVTEEYGSLLDAHRGIEQADVTSAVTLDEEQMRRVTEMMEGVVGAKVRLWAHVEPSIIGGLVARVGDRVIDGSVRTRLEKMRRSVVQRA